MDSIIEPFTIIDKGGWVAYWLAALAVVLWYAVGYRYFLLKSSATASAPLAALFAEINALYSKRMADKDIAVQSVVHRYVNQLGAHKQTIKAIVMIAPLLGLLGTVIGMIETFDSLQDAAMFSQSGGIAGGISLALITTEMGLVVAIPGVLVGRRLERKQDEIVNSIEQYVLTKNIMKESV